MVNGFIDRVRTNGDALRAYAAALSGAGGRLVISLFYFVALANTLSFADFGLFATASATGIMLSRIVGFGFTSPLYRMAAVKPQLIGVFGAGYLFFAALSTPVLLAAAWAAHSVFFDADLLLSTFLVIVLTEAFLWRSSRLSTTGSTGSALRQRWLSSVAG